MSYNHECCQYFRCDQDPYTHEDQCEGLLETKCKEFFNNGKNSAKYEMCQQSVPAPAEPVAEPDYSSQGL